MSVERWIAENLAYDAETGLITWKNKVNSRVAVGCEAGSCRDDGYRRIRIRGRGFLAHRVAWLLHHGHWPVGVIDHINRCTSDNRMANLRDTDIGESTRNQSRHDTASTGVFQASKGSWVARIYIKKRCIYLGSFRTKDLARERYTAERAKTFQKPE